MSDLNRLASAQPAFCTPWRDRSWACTADMGGVVTSMDRIYDAVMDKLRDSAPQVGMAMGVIFLVVGLVLGNFGIVGLGVVVALAGFFSRPGKS